MLTPYDIAFMEDTVRDIVVGWNLRLTVKKPLPADMQENWNSLLHEYSGPIQYNQYNNVPMERKDQSNTNIYNKELEPGAGDHDDGTLYMALSDLNDWFDDTCRVLYDGEWWQVSDIKRRIGEFIIVLQKIVGSDEKWADEPSSVIEVGDGNV